MFNKKFYTNDGVIQAMFLDSG